MLILRAFAPGQGLANPSPFVLKVMGYLHVLGLDWQLTAKVDIRKQPNGKFPVLVDGDSIIPDSGDIVRHLEAKAGRRVNDGLSADEKILSHAFVRMAEEHMYFFVVYNRWAVDENFALIKPGLEKLAPFPISKILSGIIRKQAVSSTKAQGIGRMSAQMQKGRFSADLDALNSQLADKKFLFGDKPSAADLSVVPLLAVLLTCPADTQIRRALLEQTNLTAYVERAMGELFPTPDSIVFAT